MFLRNPAWWEIEVSLERKGTAGQTMRWVLVPSYFGGLACVACLDTSALC